MSVRPGPARPGARPRPRRLLLSLAAVLVAAGCAQDGPVVSLEPTSGAPVTTGASSAAPTRAAAAPLAPLTGLPTTSAVAKRPAVAVPVPVSGGIGLDRADLVVQEYETASTLRAIAVFQSRDAAEIGPVGQIRPLDPQLLPILRPLYANAGGATGTTGLLQEAKVANLSTAAEPGAYTYGTAGLTTSTSRVLAAAPDGAPPPLPVFSYAAAGDVFASTGLRAATSVSVTAPGSATETWVYSATSKRWTRSGTAGVAVTNLILQNVEYKSVTLKNPIRSVQSARALGRGSCYAFSADHYAACSWYKPSATGLTNYVDRGGVPLRFARGSTWVVLAPPGTAVAAK